MEMIVKQYNKVLDYRHKSHYVCEILQDREHYISHVMMMGFSFPLIYLSCYDDGVLLMKISIDLFLSLLLNSNEVFEIIVFRVLFFLDSLYKEGDEIREALHYF